MRMGESAMVFVTGDCHGEYGRFSAKVFGI